MVKRNKKKVQASDSYLFWIKPQILVMQSKPMTIINILECVHLWASQPEHIMYISK